ncbi:MAG TPA: hypothetical protein VMJ12_12315 [Candidatus Acidoferrales bacterium]|nr:hypothetical protein [Candidatus Acidoferrales bacterium]
MLPQTSDKFNLNQVTPFASDDTCCLRWNVTKLGACRKVGVANKDCQAQKALLGKLDKGELQLADLQAKTKKLFNAELAKLNGPNLTAENVKAQRGR